MSKYFINFSYTQQLLSIVFDVELKAWTANVQTIVAVFKLLYPPKILISIFVFYKKSQHFEIKVF